MRFVIAIIVAYLIGIIHMSITHEQLPFGIWVLFVILIYGLLQRIIIIDTTEYDDDSGTGAA